MNRSSDSPYKTAYIRRRARESIFRGRGIVLTDGGGNRKVAQGNIIALLDNAGNIVVNYIYDAWGNHAVLDANGADITDPNHIGVLNPFRYRGYFYDVETGLYYLQTRYYDPEIGRFLNMDDVSYADPEQFHGLNLYAYCANDPVNNVDPTGHKWWHWLLGAALVALTTVAMVATAGGAAVAIGASAAVTQGMMMTAGIATGLSGIMNLATQAAQGDTLDYGSLMGDMLFSGISGMITGGVSAYVGTFSPAITRGAKRLVHKGIQVSINSLLSTSSYIIDSVLTGRDITLYGLTMSQIGGMVSGFFYNFPLGIAFTLSATTSIASYGETLYQLFYNFFFNFKERLRQ